MDSEFIETKEHKFKFRDFLALPFVLLSQLALIVAIVVGSDWTGRQIIDNFFKNDDIKF